MASEPSHQAMSKPEIEQILDHANVHDIIRALGIVFENQTADEQRIDDTKHHNKTGFSAADAKFGSQLYKKGLSNKTLSPRALAFTRRMLKKYWKQLDQANYTISSTTVIRPKLSKGFHIIDEITGDSIKYYASPPQNINAVKEQVLYYQGKFKHPMKLKYIN